MGKFDKTDKYGQVLSPGDVCVAIVDHKPEIVVYEKHSWGGKGSKGEYGRFITEIGTKSFKYSGIVFAFDPLSKRRNESNRANEAVRVFYEGIR